MFFTNNSLGFVDGSVTNNILFDIGGTLYNTKFLTAGSLEAVAFQPIPELFFLGALTCLDWRAASSRCHDVQRAWLCIAKMTATTIKMASTARVILTQLSGCLPAMAPV